MVAASGLALASACHAQAVTSAFEIPDSRVDLYAGYGYFHPINSGINHYQYSDIYAPNVTASVTGYFNRFVGVQMEGAYFNGQAVYIPCTTGTGTCYTHDAKIYTAEAGPVVRWPLGRFIPYIHALGGGARYNGPAYQSLMWGWGVTGGAGLDYVLPYFHNRFAVRPIQADFQYSQVVYGPLVLPAGVVGGFGEIDALKLSGGLVARFGEPNVSHAAMLGCTTQPANVYPGEPVAVSGSVLYLNPKKKPMYTWTTTGGKVLANDSAATIDTAGMAPGDYTVSGHVTAGKGAKEQANCTAPFSVKAFEPPTISCTATPATVTSGTTVDISTAGMSPQNRPLTYSYAASAGQVTSSGPTAKLSTAGLGATTITVTCNLVDDLGKTATASTQVTVSLPSVPAVAKSQALCSLSFERDRARPVRVNNESKACLDDIALTMQQQSDASLVIVGNASADERPEAAAERTLNIRQYLTQEKGISPSRIELRVGDTSGRTARTALVPAGAIYSDTSTQTFDERTITRHGQAYGTGRRGGAKPAGRKKRAARTSSSAEPRYVPAPPATDPPALGTPQ